MGSHQRLNDGITPWIGLWNHTTIFLSSWDHSRLEGFIRITLSKSLAFPWHPNEEKHITSPSIFHETHKFLVHWASNIMGFRHSKWTQIQTHTYAVGKKCERFDWWCNIHLELREKNGLTSFMLEIDAISVTSHLMPDFQDTSLSIQNSKQCSYATSNL